MSRPCIRRRVMFNSQLDHRVRIFYNVLDAFDWLILHRSSVHFQNLITDVQGNKFTGDI